MTEKDKILGNAYFQPVRNLLGWAAAWLIATSFATAQPVESLLAQPPAGFADELVTNLAGPTDLAFTPDGRILITQQTGQLRIFENGVLLATPALNLLDPNQDGNNADSLICNDTERGVLGVTVDPNFASNNYIYLYYTFDKASINVDGVCPRRGSNPQNPNNQVARFTLPTNNQIDLASRTVLLSNIESNSGNHNAGDLHFGSDGYLYISAGDGGIPPDATPALNAQLTSHLNGKILRIQTDGAFPASNPYAVASNVRHCGDPAGMPAGIGPCGEIFAKGLRNPFRFAIKPGSNLVHINDVGQNLWEEINLGVAGADYGWRFREGPCPYPPLGGTGCGDDPEANHTIPLHTYNHSSGCASVTGAAFVPAGIWPASYTGAYLFADYVCGKVFRLTPTTPYTTGPSGIYQFNYVNEELFTIANNFAAVAMAFDPDQTTQSLYYAACPKNNDCATGGQVRRFRYTGNLNRPPTAQIAADPTFGAMPLIVDFSAAGSSDPESDPLTFDWDFGDGSVATNISSTTIQHSYIAIDTYTAKLFARDNQGNVSDPVTVLIEVGNTPPMPIIDAPTVSDFFFVGQTITLVGSASDHEDGNLTDNQLSWQVLQHHVDVVNPGNTHAHPWLPATIGNNLQFTTPDREDSFATDSYLELILKATDSFGSSTTVTQTLLPRKIDLTFKSEPAGLVLKVGQISTLSPRTITVWDQSRVIIEASSPQTSNGKSYTFVAWSDGGLRQHTIIAPSADSSFTITFQEDGVTPTATATLTPTATATATAMITATATSQSTLTFVPTKTLATTFTPTFTPTTLVATATPTPKVLEPKHSFYLPLINR